MPSWYRALVRWAFRRFYGEFAWSYDAVAWIVSRGLWWQWAGAALPFLSGRVLEIGFGTGYIQLALAERANQLLVGVDASPQMVAIARHRLVRADRAANLLRAVAQELPFVPASFDTVVATFPAEYLLDPRTHDQIERVLVPGGRLVIVPFAQLDGGLYTRLIDLAYRFTLQGSVRRNVALERRLEQVSFGAFQMEQHWVVVGPSRVLVLVSSER